MNRTLHLTSAVVIAGLSLWPVSAGAQERRGRENEHERGGWRQAAPRSRARGDDGRQDERRGERRGDDRRWRDERRGEARGHDRQWYGGQSYRDDDRRDYDRPRDGWRSYSYARPYYSRPYVRPYGYVPYRPYYFSRPYYSFRPRFSIGFGLWLGSTVPYPYAYLGGYRPRVYGRYDGYYGRGYQVSPGVPIYGGVSFDLQPSDADLFLDGEYVGSVGSFTPYGEPLTLTPGEHRIAIQRDGFRSMEWDVTIEPGQVIPYRGVMERY